MKINRRTWLLTAVSALLLGCGRGNEQATEGLEARRQSVVAFVAASTKDAVQEAATLFTDEFKTRVKINADDSSKLATQIVNDAPAHLFLSANEKWADFVKEKGYASESKPLLSNTLVIVVPKGNPAAVKKPADLLKPEVTRLALAGPKVPAGIYARQALEKLNLWEPLEREKKITAADNVRVALTYVERGECEAGIVYGTDARISDNIEVVYTFDSSAHEPIRYPLMLLQGGHKQAGARAFYDFLFSESATKVFLKHGFVVLDGK